MIRTEVLGATQRLFWNTLVQVSNWLNKVFMTTRNPVFNEIILKSITCIDGFRRKSGKDSLTLCRRSSYLKFWGFEVNVVWISVSRKSLRFYGPTRRVSSTLVHFGHTLSHFTSHHSLPRPCLQSLCGFRKGLVSHVSLHVLLSTSCEPSLQEDRGQTKTLRLLRPNGLKFKRPPSVSQRHRRLFFSR